MIGGKPMPLNILVSLVVPEVSFLNQWKHLMLSVAAVTLATFSLCLEIVSHLKRGNNSGWFMQIVEMDGQRRLMVWEICCEVTMGKGVEEWVVVGGGEGGGKIGLLLGLNFSFLFLSLFFNFLPSPSP